MKYLFSILLFLSLNSFGQDSLSFGWSKMGQLKVDSSSFWMVDNLHNQYIVRDNAINKFDSTGTLKFSQSIKSFGEPKQIIAINAMKLVHFSTAQQTICFMDNTLTQSEDCIDLFDLGILNASMICSSSRPNKLWIYDDLNTTLNLVDLEGQITKQEWVNLAGMLQVDSAIQMMEVNNRFYLLDAGRGLYVFDLFGTLLDFISEKNITAFQVQEKTIFYIKDNQLFARFIDTGEVLDFNLPVRDVRSFTIRGGMFYFRTNDNVHKFRLQF